MLMNRLFQGVQGVADETAELITYLKGSKFNPNTMPSDQLKQMALGIKSKYASSLDEVE